MWFFQHSVLESRYFRLNVDFYRRNVNRKYVVKDGWRYERVVESKNVLMAVVDESPVAGVNVDSFSGALL